MSKLTNEQGVQYRVAPFTLEDLGRRDTTSVAVQVQGYWSYDPITIYVERSFRWSSTDTTPDGTWKVTISHSSGGRDTKEVESDVEATQNFAMALLAACNTARGILGSVAKLEEVYQAQKAADAEARRVEDEAKAAEKAKRVAADAELGSEGAIRIVAAARNATTRRVSHMIYAYPMGEEQPEAICVRAGRDNVIRFTLGGQVISAANLTAKLVGYSVRTQILVG